MAEKANLRMTTISSTLKTNTICPLSSSLILLLSGLPLCLGPLNKCLFKMGFLYSSKWDKINTDVDNAFTPFSTAYVQAFTNSWVVVVVKYIHVRILLVGNRQE